jgi:hypothetical protein
MDAEPKRLRLFGFSEFCSAKLRAREAKIRMDADALGRHGGRLFPVPGVLRSKTPSSQNGMDAIL